MLGIKTSHLSAEEIADFEQCKKVVSACLNGYKMMGTALRKIRDKQYYRTTHETFEAFIHDEWQMSPQHARRLMSASTLAELLEPTGSVPESERQARALSGLTPPLQVAAWTDAVAEANGGQPTTPQIAAAVQKRKKPLRRKKPKPVRIRVPGAIVIVELASATSSVEEALASALQKLTSKAAA